MRGLFSLPHTFNKGTKKFAKQTKIYGIAMQTRFSGPRHITSIRTDPTGMVYYASGLEACRKFP